MNTNDDFNIYGAFLQEAWEQPSAQGIGLGIQAQEAILSALPVEIREKIESVAERYYFDHCTLLHRRHAKSEDGRRMRHSLESMLGAKCELIADSVGFAVGKDGETIIAAALGVSEIRSDKKIPYRGDRPTSFPHITIATANGGKPKDSNAATQWIRLPAPIAIPATVGKADAPLPRPRPMIVNESDLPRRSEEFAAICESDLEHGIEAFSSELRSYGIAEPASAAMPVFEIRVLPPKGDDLEFGKTSLLFPLYNLSNNSVWAEGIMEEEYGFDTAPMSDRPGLAWAARFDETGRKQTNPALWLNSPPSSAIWFDSPTEAMAGYNALAAAGSLKLYENAIAVSAGPKPSGEAVGMIAAAFPGAKHCLCVADTTQGRMFASRLARQLQENGVKPSNIVTFHAPQGYESYKDLSIGRKSGERWRSLGERDSMIVRHIESLEDIEDALSGRRSLLPSDLLDLHKRMSDGIDRLYDRAIASGDPETASVCCSEIDHLKGEFKEAILSSGSLVDMGEMFDASARMKVGF